MFIEEGVYVGSEDRPLVPLLLLLLYIIIIVVV